MRSIRLLQAVFTVFAVNLFVFSTAEKSPNLTVAAATNNQNLTVAAAEESKITEEQVSQLFAEVFKALNNRNSQQVMKFLAPKYSGEVTVITPEGPQTVRTNRAEYLQQIEEAKKNMQEYRVSYSNIQTKVSSEGTKAETTATITEEFTLEGKKFKGTSSNTTNLELIDGQILATSSKSKLLDLLEVN